VTATPNSATRVFSLEPTAMPSAALENVVIHAEIRDEYVQELFLRSSQPAGESLGGIDNICVFIGNKTFYFPREEIAAWERSTLEGLPVYKIPAGPYRTSVIKPWINWYGDFNLALKEITAFFSNPFGFSLSWFFIVFILVMFWTDLCAAYGALTEKRRKILEMALLALMTAFAFALRVDGLTRFSSWLDELYSSATADPSLPFMNTFGDPGNPPLYFILLRFWFILFGWSETSGRFLSVIIGLFAILSLYAFVKTLCGRKHAMLSAFLLTISSSAIGYSNEMRAYILLIALASLCARRFIVLLGNQNTKNTVLYILGGALIVNTHYFGVLFIAADFLFYFMYHKRRTALKQALLFLSANIVIALSLVPYFAVTAFQKALTNPDFNSWILHPGRKDIFVACMLSAACMVYYFARRYARKRQLLTEEKILLFDYALFTGYAIYMLAFLISLKRPILTWRYLVICLPLIFAILPTLVGMNIHNRGILIVINVYSLIFMCNFAVSFRAFGGGLSDVYKEAQHYIEADIRAHEAYVPSEWNNRLPCFYGFQNIPPYEPHKGYTMLYMNPLHKNERQMDLQLEQFGLDARNMLKIKINRDKYIYKKYISPE
jgi:hypothetical protein